ncbi:hypothetical protein CY652_22280 [Burkholderia sp. WAC0059]|nr:hypothetical protein CY652_22280 [Burkholderia sp. WAC0059]
MPWRRSGRQVQSGVRGMALPVVLLVTSMMLVTTAAWFESVLLGGRGARGLADHLQAFHAADAALTLCSRALVAGAMPLPLQPVESSEPDAWRRKSTFNTQATTPVSAWPGSARSPQCVAESWRLATRPEAQAFLLTARGFGASADTQSWLQLQLVLDGQTIERHWRRVVARPF